MSLDNNPPHVVARSSNPTPVHWGRVVLASIVVVVPALGVGVLLGSVIVSITGQIDEHPVLANLLLIGAGLVSGLAVGRFMKPTVGKRAAYLAITAVVAAVAIVLALVFALSKAASSTIDDISWFRYALGPAVVVAVQTLVAALFWRFRRRNR